MPFLGSTLLLLACVVPALAVPTPQPVAPDVVETIIFETAVVARTQTAELLLPTQAVTSTPTPTKTPTNTPSPTSTILIILPTYTQVVLPTLTFAPGEVGKPTDTPSPNEHDYTGSKKCAVVGQSPPDGTVFRPRQKFTGSWTIKNTGTAAWKKGWFDYQYLGGDKFHDRARYDMNFILDPGDTIDIKVVMHAPKQPGSYETTWIFGSKKNALCKMTLAIVVE